MAAPTSAARAETAYRCDLAASRRSFDRAAESYEGAAVVQSRAREELLGRLDYVALAPRLVVDAGAGTAVSSLALARRYPRARIVALDASLAMLRAARRGRPSWRRSGRFERGCGALQRMPFADASVDLLFSTRALPWCELDEALAEARRVLAPHGLFSCTSLGPDTLRELRLAWAQADGGGAHVHHFLDMHDLGDALVRAGFSQPVLDVERRTVRYGEFADLVAALRACGGRNVLAARPRGLTGRHKARVLREAYERQRRDGALPASGEVVFAHAWAGSARAPTAAPGADATIRLEEFTRGLRARERR